MTNCRNIVSLFILRPVWKCTRKMCTRRYAFFPPTLLTCVRETDMNQDEKFDVWSDKNYYHHISIVAQELRKLNFQCIRMCFDIGRQ